MNGDAGRWRSCLWLHTLVFAWHNARGYAATFHFQRPFSRDWEDLLKTAGLISAEARHEAARDAMALQAAGVVDLKTAKYRPYQIERVIVPFGAEERLRALFSHELPGPPEPKFDFASVKWASQLNFLVSETATIAPDDLLKLNDFLLTERHRRPLVPIKERSLEIFGDEKRLDALLSTSLFRRRGLDLVKDLKCEIIGEPLAWNRGPSGATSKPIIVIENAATWHSYCRLNSERVLFGAVVYGCGNRFADSVHYLTDIFAELGGPCQTLYFGDLDPQGLLIPQEASGRAQANGLPTIEPHYWSYRQLLRLGMGRAQPWDGEPAAATLCDWLGELAEPVRTLFAANHRLAQEHVGWEFLQNHRDME